MTEDRRNAAKVISGRRGKFPAAVWDQCREQFRGLQTRINYSFDNERYTLLVTSAVSAEGKTTTAVNLARSLSTASRKVLLVDADLRRPKIHKLFSVRNSPGMTDMLYKGFSATTSPIPTNVAGLEILPSGTSDADPAELFLSEKIEDFFEKALLFYDYVVIDAPPVLPVTDAVILSRLAHGVLMVTECGKTPREVVKEAIGELKGARIVGLAMNKIPATKRYYDYYGYY